MNVANHSTKRKIQPDRLVFLSFTGMAIGICGGLIAIGLLTAIAVLSNFCFYGKFSTAYMVPTTDLLHGWVIILPAIGGLLVGILVRYFSPEIKGDGIPEAMSVVLTNGSMVKPRVGFFKPLSAALTIGTGGPFGAEGPIIQTGGAIGSIFGQIIQCSAAERRILLACGAAAGLAGVFKTPFAGVMMAVELLVFEFRARSFIPIALASTCGTLVAMAFRGSNPVFPVQGTYHFQMLELPFFVLLAFFCAGMAWVMTKTLYISEDFFEKAEHHFNLWYPIVPTIGGLIVGGIGYFYPQVFGVGYKVIADILSNPHALHTLVGIGVAKLLAFGAALGTGCSGGTFAPALMIGGSMGAAFGSIVHKFLPTSASIGIYGMIATAALFGGIYRATPTAILFMLEVTGCYQAMFPLFMVCIVSDLVVRHLMETTINTERLVRRGIPVPDAYVADPMRLMRIRQVMTTSVESIRGKQRVVEFLSESAHHEELPVVDGSDHLVGMLHRTDLLKASPDATAAQLAQRTFPVCYADELVHDVALRVIDGGDRVCPVLERDTGALVGIVTAFDFLKAKQWETMQEIPQPGHLAVFSLLRVRSKTATSTSEQEREDAAHEPVHSGR